MTPQEGQILMIRSRLEAMPIHTIDPILLQGDLEFLLAELNRQRERMAALEAVAKLALQLRKHFRYFDPPTFPGSGCSADIEHRQLHALVSQAEAALSGGTAALDAAIAEATAKLTEERDILSNAYDRAAHGWSEVAEQLAEAQDAIKVENTRRQALESRISELIAEAKKLTEERDALREKVADYQCKLAMIRVAIKPCGCIRGFYSVDCADHKDQLKMLARWKKAHCAIEQWPVEKAHRTTILCGRHKGGSNAD